MKRSSIFIVILTLMLLATVPAVAGPNGTDRPIEGDVTGYVQWGGEGSPDGLANIKGCNDDGALPGFFSVTTFTTAYGTMSHLGKVHMESAHCPVFEGPSKGQMAFVAANGDTLYGEYMYATPGTLDVLLTFGENTMGVCPFLHGVGCESTGRFAGATGSAIVKAGTSEFDPDDMWAHLDYWASIAGTVTYGISVHPTKTKAL